MNDGIEKALFTILGGAISALTGFFASKLDRRRTAKDHFAVIISRAIGDIQNDGGVLVFHNSSRPIIKEAVYELLPKIKRKDRPKREALWSQYDQLGKPETHYKTMTQPGARVFLRKRLKNSRILFLSNNPLLHD